MPKLPKLKNNCNSLPAEGVLILNGLAKSHRAGRKGRKEKPILPLISQMSAR
jgi:hypothetical protein